MRRGADELKAPGIVIVGGGNISLEDAAARLTKTMYELELSPSLI